MVDHLNKLRKFAFINNNVFHYEVSIQRTSMLFNYCLQEINLALFVIIMVNNTKTWQIHDMNVFTSFSTVKFTYD